MTRHKNETVVPAADNADSCLFGCRQDFKLTAGFYILFTHICVTGMRHIKLIIKATEQHRSAFGDRVLEHTEQFFLQRILFDIIMMIQTSLGTPTNVHRRENMAGGPLHDGNQFRPIFHLFKGKILHWRTRNDHPIKVLILDVRKCFVEIVQILFRYMLGIIAFHPQQGHFHLQGRIRK